MAPLGADTPKPFRAKLDQFFFFKRWYCFFSHFIPFAVAALLLLVLSLPTDNLLVKLATNLNAPGSLLVPAAFLTLVTFLVYLATMLATIRQAYLWPTYDWPRAVFTSLFYAGLCGVMAYLVLNASAPQPWSWGRIWACALLALLSLTGLGWSLPSKWVDLIGVKLPDYTAGHQAVERLFKVIQRIRQQPTTKLADCEDALSAAKKLLESIDTNRPLEPAWALPLLDDARGALKKFVDQLDQTFIKGDPIAQSQFGSASQCETGSAHTDYIAALRRVADFWPELRCPERGK